jgi:hypothetical protein
MQATDENDGGGTANSGIEVLPPFFEGWWESKLTPATARSILRKFSAAAELRFFARRENFDGDFRLARLILLSFESSFQ